MTPGEVARWAEYLFRLDDEQERERVVTMIAREARREALEEAEMVCRTMYRRLPIYRDFNEAADKCASAVRALADAPDAGAGG